MTQAHANLLEILRRGGAVKSSDWTTGTGSHTSRRATPEGAREILACQVPQLPNPRPRAAAMRVLDAHPRTRKLIIISDWTLADRLAETPKLVTIP